MALVKPIVNDIAAFDATQNYTITFTVNGGDQVTKNRIQVVTNDSSETLVYDNSTPQSYYSLSHVIPANTLTNGEYYKTRIKTYDVLDNDSEWSDYKPFWCYSTPSLEFQSFNANSETINVTLVYNQTEGEKIKYAKIQLYSSNNILIQDSGNLYDTNNPPLTFDYLLTGLKDHTKYKLKGTVVTIQDTTVTTGYMEFRVNYSGSTDALVAEVNNCDGYINLQSNVIVKMDVTSNPSPLTYIDNEKADLLCAPSDLDVFLNESMRNYIHWARWGSLVIPKNFLLRLWCYPARQPFDIIKISNGGSSVYLEVSLKRSVATDYISIRTNSGTTIDKPLGLHCNGNTKVFIWIKVIGSTWDVQTSILDTDSTILNWNDDSDNIQYNVTSDITWGNESYETFIPPASEYYAMSGNMSTVLIANGIYDHLNLTEDTSITYNTNPPSYYTPETILNIDFNGSIGETTNYTRLLLMRKDNTMTNWINLVDINSIPAGTPTYIDFNDKFIPSGIEQTYTLVTYINNTPSEYYSLTVTPNWGKYFLSDKDTEFVLNYAVLYNGHVQNIQNGVFMPIGARYPIVVQNGNGVYRSGSLQFKVLGYQYEENKRLDRFSITKQLDDILAFLTNGKAKCLTDFNGNIFLLKVINSPQISYDGNWGNGIPTISFDWVEQGKYNNNNDMSDLGLVDYISD